MDLIVGALRAASPGVSTGRIEDLAGCSGLQRAISVTNSSTGPDEMSLVYGSGGVLTSLFQSYSTGANFLRILDGSELSVGDRVLVTNLDQGHVVRVTGIWNLGAGNGWALGVSTGCAAAVPTTYDAQSLVIRVKIARLFVDTAFDPPLLMYDPDIAPGGADAEPVADGIEDLQIAIGVDLDGDGLVSEPVTTTDEWFYNLAGDAAAPDLGNDSDCGTNAAAACPYRAIRITLVARSVGEINTGAASFRPSAEDHDGAASADAFKRRSLTTTVELRNLEGSP